jgi:hypothetical protein
MTELLHLENATSWLHVAVERTLRAGIPGMTVEQVGRIASHLRRIRLDVEQLADTLAPGGPPRGPQGPAETDRPGVAGT